jgi:large subunit ribosomal protein L30
MTGKKKKAAAEKKRMVMVRVRGEVHVNADIEDTLRLLHLVHINHCVVIDTRPEYAGMIAKVKDYVTWGEVAPETFEHLLVKRGKIAGGKALTDEYMKKNTKYATIKKFADDFLAFKAEMKDAAGVKPVFKLSPPVKGYDRGGIKKPYSLGGALGYRKEKINELIERMI